MSYRPGSRPLHPSERQAVSARPQQTADTAGTRRTDYTLAHAGRQVRLGPVAFWIAVGTLVVMGVWTITTATYFAFRDDVLTSLIARQAELQFAYEDRIAELRAQVDRISSRQLLDQEQYEQKLDQMLKRQAALEARAKTLNALPDTTVTGSTRRSEQPRSGAMRPSPIHDHGNIAPQFTRPTQRGASRGIDVDAALSRLHASLDQVERQQRTMLSSMEDGYDAKVRRIRGVLTELGIDAGRPSARNTAVGGPFVAARSTVDAGSFDYHLHRLTVARAQVDHLMRTVVTVPLRKPVLGEMDLSSGFGMRIDPFIRAPAMHTGLDFRGDTGDPVRATANGKVTVANWNGGYGRMVEIDHGNGLITRYGHLSAISVTIGQSVRAGQVIGKIGSTGRSTGPHLHYETRVGGDAVDPLKFLRAGSKLGGIY